MSDQILISNSAIGSSSKTSLAMLQQIERGSVAKEAPEVHIFAKGLRAEVKTAPFIPLPSVVSPEFKDTIEFGSTNNSMSSRTTSPRAILPVPQNKQSQNALQILAEAFGSASSALNSGLIDEVNSYANLQELDQTEATEVLDSTTKTMKKQAKEAKIEEQITEIEKNALASADKWYDITFYVGIAILAITIGCGLVSLLADAAPLIVNTVADVTDTGIGDGFIELTDMSSDMSTIEPTETPESTTNSTVNSDPEVTTRYKVGKFLLKMAIMSGLTSPMLMKAWAQYDLAAKLEELAPVQKSVGEGLAAMQRVNGNFQFMQQLLQRASSTIVNEIQGASDMLQTFGHISSSYQTICTQLANSV